MIQATGETDICERGKDSSHSTWTSWSGLTWDEDITSLCLHDLLQSISKLVWNVMRRRYRAKEIFNLMMLISRSNLFTQKHPKW